MNSQDSKWLSRLQEGQQPFNFFISWGKNKRHRSLKWSQIASWGKSLLVIINLFPLICLFQISNMKQANANRVLPRECTGHSKHPFPTTQEMTLHMESSDGQYSNQADYCLCSQWWRSSMHERLKCWLDWFTDSLLFETVLPSGCWEKSRSQGMEIALPARRKRISSAVFSPCNKYWRSIFASLPVAMETVRGTHVNSPPVRDMLRSPMQCAFSTRVFSFWLRDAVCSYISKLCGFRPQTRETPV